MVTESKLARAPISYDQILARMNEIYGLELYVPDELQMQDAPEVIDAEINQAFLSSDTSEAKPEEPKPEPAREEPQNLPAPRSRYSHLPVDIGVLSPSLPLWPPGEPEPWKH